MGATKPTSPSGSRPAAEGEPKKTNAGGRPASAEREPGAKTEVEEEHHARLAKQELTIKSLGERLDSHADAAREILETIATMPQRLRDLEAEVSTLRAAVAAAAEAAMTKRVKESLDSARAELKAAEVRATRGAEALSDSMKNSLMLNMRVQALEGLMQDVMLKTSTLPALQPAKTASEHQLFAGDAISASSGTPTAPSIPFSAAGVPPLEVPRMAALELARGRAPPAWAVPGSRELAEDPGTGLPMAPKLTGLLRDKPSERKGSCSAWW